MKQPDKHALYRIAGGEDEDMKVEMSSCMTCKRKRAGGPQCDAFPERIPDAILEMEHDHKTPYPGDGGLLYLPDKESQH